MSRKAVLKQVLHTVVLNTVFTITSSQTFTVPETGYYSIEMHGGGGGGGGAYYMGSPIVASNSGSGGGGSGQLYTGVHLTKGTQYNVTIGGGGLMGWAHGDNGVAGGTTSFGSLYSLAGGGGGVTATSFSAVGGGSASGSLASAGPQSNVYQTTSIGGVSGGYGNTNKTSQTYGNGGASGWTNNGACANGANGSAGAVILTLTSY